MLHMCALIYTQLGVSPDTQKQTGFAGYPSRKDLNFSYYCLQRGWKLQRCKPCELK